MATKIYEAFCEDVKELLDSVLFKKDGKFVIEPYVEPCQRLDNEVLARICESDDPDGALIDELEEIFDYGNDEYDKIFNELKPHLLKTYSEEYVEDNLLDVLHELAELDLPLDHFLNQEVCADIFIDTGDANYDFSLNHWVPSWGGQSEGKIDEKASIRWLANTQGYTEEQLRNHLLNGEDMSNPTNFLESMYVELANCATCCPCLVFLVRITVNELIKLNKALKKTNLRDKNLDRWLVNPKDRPDAGFVTLKKATETGLFSSWAGSGGPFEIILEKDIKLPVNCMHSILPDGEEGRYSVEEVYGVSKSIWRKTLDISGLKPVEDIAVPA